MKAAIAFKMPRKRRDIENALKAKGFREEVSHHRYYKYFVDNKFTGAYTYTSTGTKHKEYDDSLLARMVKQLKLNSRQELCDLIDCPMDEEQYRAILHEKGIL